MIHSFSCKNFYSIYDEVEVSFVVNNKAPKSYGYFETQSGNRLSKVEMVIGPNASGKTHLLKVLPFFKWLISDSFRPHPYMPLLPVKPFASKDGTEPTQLKSVFEIDGNVYTYVFELNQQRIISEKLSVTRLVKKKKSSKKLFVRVWDEKENRYKFEVSNFELPPSFEFMLRPDTSVVNIASHLNLNHEESKKIVEAWSRIETNVREYGWIGDSMISNMPKEMFDALLFYSENKSIKNKMEKILSKFDMSLEKVEIEKEEAPGKLGVKVEFVHNIDESSKPIVPLYESSGTKQLLVILKSILLALEKGGVAVIDELDANLHPEIVSELVDLFLYPETNPHNAQLIFSSHSHILLTKLDKYQIVLTQKNDKGSTEVWRLDQMKGVRPDDNYYMKYLSGAYGAIPEFD